MDAAAELLLAHACTGVQTAQHVAALRRRLGCAHTSLSLWPHGTLSILQSYVCCIHWVLRHHTVMRHNSIASMMPPHEAPHVSVRSSWARTAGL